MQGRGGLLAGYLRRPRSSFAKAMEDRYRGFATDDGTVYLFYIVDVGAQEKNRKDMDGKSTCV